MHQGRQAFAGYSMEVSQPVEVNEMIKIMVATDLSDRSALALQRAVRLIRQQGGGDWCLLHVVDDQAPQAYVAEHVQRVQALLEEEAPQLAEDAGSRPQVLVGSGEVEEVVAKAAEEQGIDLVLVGAQRRSALRDFFVGRSVERLIRSSHRPVLRVAAPVNGDYHKALVALDDSSTSLHALASVRKLGLVEPEQCHALRVLEPVPMGTLAEAGIDYRQLEQNAGEVLQMLRGELKEAGLGLPDGQVRVEQGQPRQVIADAFKQSQADLLVIGSHARKGLSRLVLGSVASGLLSDLQCDILCVPPQAARSSTAASP